MVVTSTEYFIFNLNHFVSSDRVVRNRQNRGAREYSASYLELNHWAGTLFLFQTTCEKAPIAAAGLSLVHPPQVVLAVALALGRIALDFFIEL